MLNGRRIIFLTGQMGAGKTYLGKQIAERLSMDFLDTDDLIESKRQMTVSEIFESEGESAFRQMEKECLSEQIDIHSNCVIATGGGLPCFHNNAELMLQSGLVIHLKAETNLLILNLLSEIEKRPLLKNNRANLETFLDEQYKKRSAFYEKAHICIHLRTRNTGTESLIKRLYPFFQKSTIHED